MKIFYWLFLNLGLSIVHKKIEDFLLINVLQKGGKFQLLISLLLAASGCCVNRAWLQCDVRKGTLSHACSVKYRAVGYLERRQQRFWRS